MVVHNRFTAAPERTDIKRIVTRKDGNIVFDVEVWARYFPGNCIEYHVNVREFDRNSILKILASCWLIASGTTKRNQSRRAEIEIVGGRVYFYRIPQFNHTSGRAVCGLEQISLVDVVLLDCFGVERITTL